MPQIRLSLFVALLCTAATFAAETPAPAYADKTPQRYHLTKRASEIDPRAKEYPAIDFTFKDKAGKVQDLQHAVVDTRVAPRGRLVIWLMGYNVPLFERLGDYGLHAIQVHYANKWFGLIPNQARDDGTSLGKMRLEATTGIDATTLAEISPQDGMMERAYQLVKHLAKEHPQGRWEQFIAADGKGLNWEKVIVAGASHGATSAARFAKHQRVDRVVMFCGPRDQLESWHGFASATPANRFFGFTHVLDGGWTGDHYCRSWQMLGLNAFGPITDVDASAAPWGNSRRLITKFDVKGDAKKAHSSVTPGNASAKNAKGEFVHEAVWKYLFTHPVDAVGVATPLDPECGEKLPKF